ncbi:hypothetical protein [Flavobacterium sp. UBA7663]|uniref:hypothetical protein n=1 Tax=Flavobacterium sp. UBA7663 TaxID=1946557 RepID=UPI0025B8F851|nr:hypothetical protein [Flavobacterium sp. UBA7663]
MGLFDFFRKSKKHNVALHSVAKKLKISEESIVAILKEAGFEIYNFPYTFLNEKHLEILSQKYVEAIKSFYSSSSKNFYDLNNYQQIEVKKFFTKFIRYNLSFNTCNQELIDDNFFKSKLDSELIKDFFYRLIDEIEFEAIHGNIYHTDSISIEGKEFTKFLYKIKLKTKSTFNNIKSKLFSILTTCHYYIFSDDEDHIAKAKLELCFSAMRDLSGEALKNINYLKFRIKWKKLKYS